MKRLAMTKDGRLTFCTASEENIGKGRCNHIAHQNYNESPEAFLDRINKESAGNHSSKEINAPNDIRYLRKGLLSLDSMMKECGCKPMEIKTAGGFAIYELTGNETRSICTLTKLDDQVKSLVRKISDESDGALEPNWLNDDIAYFDSSNDALRLSIDKYLSLHPEEFKCTNDGELSNLSMIKIKNASADAVICMKYASIKNKKKMNDIDDLVKLVHCKKYDGKSLYKLIKKFGMNVDIFDFANDLYSMGVIKTEDEYLSTIM